MAQNIGTSEASDLATADPDFSVFPENTDAQGAQKLTFWTNQNWAQWLGYYKTKNQATPDLNGVINTIATYTIGKGFTADTATKKILEGIKGMGKDTFDTIMENMIITGEIGGDSYAEIIQDKSGKLINLKPLDPGVMRHGINAKGIIKRFDQLEKAGSTNVVQKFKPKDIFYLPRQRVADEVHGTSLTEKLVQINKFP